MDTFRSGGTLFRDSTANGVHPISKASVYADTEPGWHVPVLNYAPAHTTGVDVTFYAYGIWGGGGTGGEVYLRDSGGVVSGSNITGFNTTGEWKSVTLTLTSAGGYHRVMPAMRSSSPGTDFWVESMCLYLHKP